MSSVPCCWTVPMVWLLVPAGALGRRCTAVLVLQVRRHAAVGSVDGRGCRGCQGGLCARAGGRQVGSMWACLLQC